MSARRFVVRVFGGITIVACAADTAGAPVSIVASQSHAAAVYSDWSEPIAFPEGINSSVDEQNAVMSNDGLALYFSSARPGGMGGLDIYIAKRASLNSPWGAPVNAGFPINTASNDFAPNFSIDQHLLFFSSARPGGFGGPDVYFMSRSDPKDDFAWTDLTHLGPDVNTAAFENAPFFLQSAEDGRINLHFNRTVPERGADLFRAAMKRNGEVLGPAEPVSEVNSVAGDAAVTIRRDGREMFFWSPRTGGEGSNDLWTSTRQTVHHAWAPPSNVGSLNTANSDVTPWLSGDGLMLIFGSSRAGGLGGQDIYYATRTRIPAVGSP